MPDTLPATRFKFYTGGLEAIEEASRKQFRTIASSTIVDRQGDQFTVAALESMAKTASAGLTIFRNHSYNIPDDVLGTVKNAEIKQRGDVWDLELTIDVLESEPKAMQTWEAIKSGVQLGCSVGALVKNAWREKDGTVKIDEVELLEASIVGIPANPRSWVERAVKSLTENTENTDEGTEPSIVSGILPVSPFASTISKLADPEVSADAEVQTGTLTAPKLADVEPNPKASPEVVSEQVTEVPEQESPAPRPVAESADSDNHAHVTTPNIAPAQVTQTSEDDAPKESDQEAQKSTPESAKDGADEPDLVKAVETHVATLTPDHVSAYTQLVDLLKSTTTELVETKKELAAKTARTQALELELKNAETNVRSAIEAVEKLAATPLGTKTSFAYQIRDFREKFAGVYSEDFLKLLTSGENDA